MYRGAISLDEFEVLLTVASDDLEGEGLLIEVEDLVRRVRLGLNQTALQKAGIKMGEQLTHRPAISEGGTFPTHEEFREADLRMAREVKAREDARITNGETLVMPRMTEEALDKIGGDIGGRLPFEPDNVSLQDIEARKHW